MNTRDAQALIEKLKELPPDRVAEFEDFVDFLAAKVRREQAGGALREMWSRMHNEELTEEIE